MEMTPENNVAENYEHLEHHTAPENHGIQSEEVFLGEDGDQPKLSGVKIIMTVLLVVVATSGLFTLGWFAYNSSSKLSAPTTLETIKADNNPSKVKPDEPGGMVVPNMDKTVYDNLSGSASQDSLPKAERLMPTPEEPVDRNKLASTTPDKQDAAVAKQPEPAKTPEQTATTATPATPAATVPTPAPAPTPAKKVAKPAAAETADNDSSDTAANKVAPKKDLTIVPENNKVHKQNPAKAAADSGYKVQLASVKSEKDAVNSWNKMKATHAELLGQLNYFIERKDLGDKGIYYRLKAGTISSQADARLLCKKLTDLGQGCLVVK